MLPCASLQVFSVVIFRFLYHIHSSYSSFTLSNFFLFTKINTSLPHFVLPQRLLAVHNHLYQPDRCLNHLAYFSGPNLTDPRLHAHPSLRPKVAPTPAARMSSVAGSSFSVFVFPSPASEPRRILSSSSTWRPSGPSPTCWQAPTEPKQEDTKDRIRRRERKQIGKEAAERYSATSSRSFLTPFALSP